MASRCVQRSSAQFVLGTVLVVTGTLLEVVVAGTVEVVDGGTVEVVVDELGGTIVVDDVVDRTVPAPAILI